MHLHLRPLALAILTLIVLAGIAGCGKSNASSSGSGTNGTPTTVHKCGFFTRVKIGLHIGVAYVAFKRWIYDPWKRGEFHSGASHRTSRIVKAVIAALVALHEAKVAVRQLRACGAGQAATRALGAVTATLVALKASHGSGVSDTQLQSQVQGLSQSYGVLKRAATG